ncbi:MAG: transcriptional regulator [Rickettsiales bacterium]|nr:transcriptional regulator [Rickettsiales bacterium]|tara:strand:+ start:1058 stop:1531 length:474 start_codon:yes stop_codon:yes gene_type:complete
MQTTAANTVRQKKARALKTISEAAELVDVPQHVLRFWETKFAQIKPLKRNGGRRFYRPEDIEVLLQIKFLLYKKGYTIKGAKKAFEQLSAEEIRTAFTEVGKGEAAEAVSNDNAQAIATAEPAHEPSTQDAVDSDHLKTIAKELRQLSTQLRTKGRE